MSLLYDATGDLIDHSPSVSPSESGGIVIWLYLSDLTLRMSAWHHLGGCDIQITIRGDTTDDFECFRGGAAYWEAGANISEWGSLITTGKWIIVGWLYGGATAPEILVGDETTAMVGPGTYTFQNTGSGADTTSGTLRAGSNFNTARYWRNRVGGYVWWNGTRPTAADAEEWRTNPSAGSFSTPPDHFWRVGGDNGTTSVPDEIGSLDGTASGLSSADYEPAVLFPASAGGGPVLGDGRAFGRGRVFGGSALRHHQEQVQAFCRERAERERMIRRAARDPRRAA